MKIKRITEDFTIATQMTPEKVAKVAQEGYRSIMCNRPDREMHDQPEFSLISKKAKQHGLESRYVPISLEGATEDDKERFYRALRELPKPVFAYCRSGTRCLNLWIAVHNRLD